MIQTTEPIFQMQLLVLEYLDKQSIGEEVSLLEGRENHIQYCVY